jgi:hypothetical protein
MRGKGASAVARRIVPPLERATCSSSAHTGTLVCVAVGRAPSAKAGLDQAG